MKEKDKKKEKKKMKKAGLKKFFSEAHHPLRIRSLAQFHH